MDSAATPAERRVLARAVTTAEDAAERIARRWGDDVLQGRDLVELEIDPDPLFAGNAAWSDAVIAVSPLRERGARRTVATSLDTMLHELGHGAFDDVRAAGSLDISTWWGRSYQELGADLIAIGARPSGAGDWKMFADGSAVAGVRELGGSTGFMHASELPTGRNLGPGMQAAPYRLAGLLGGVVRDATAAGVPEDAAVTAWVRNLERVTRHHAVGNQPMADLNRSLQVLRTGTINATRKAAGAAAGRAMEQAWDGRGLTDTFIAQWRPPSLSGFR